MSAEHSLFIVLGSGVTHNNRPGFDAKLRVVATAQLIKEHPMQASVILTGGRTAGFERASEAESMLPYLRRVLGGIKADIYLENKAKDTSTNLVNSIGMQNELHIPGQVVVVTNGYHVKRVQMICEKLGITAAVVGAEEVVTRRSLFHGKVVDQAVESHKKKAIIEQNILCITQMPFGMTLLRLLADHTRK